MRLFPRKGTFSDLLQRRAERPSGVAALIVLIISLLLGVYLLIHALEITHIPKPPTVEGSTRVFVSDPDIRTQLNVTFKDAFAEQPCFTAIVVFSGIERGKSFDWALVLTGDAMISEEVTGDTEPFTSSHPVELVRRDLTIPTSHPVPATAQILSGSGKIGEESRIQSVDACLSGPVSSAGRTRLFARLPTYGRAPIVRGLSAAEEEDEWELGIPGGWHPPHGFRVFVSLGEIDQRMTLDLISPWIKESSNLTWKDDEVLAIRIAATKTDDLNQQQVILLLIGTAIGVLASVVVMAADRAFQRLLGRFASRGQPPTPR